MRGCAADVIGAMDFKVGGSVSWFGKRMGDTKGLEFISSCI